MAMFQTTTSPKTQNKLNNLYQKYLLLEWSLYLCIICQNQVIKRVPNHGSVLFFGFPPISPSWPVETRLTLKLSHRREDNFVYLQHASHFIKGLTCAQYP